VTIRVTRTARASWRGTVPEGGGRLALGSGAFEGDFTLRARIDDVARATNPEELIAAASAGCYTMSLADLLTEDGHPPADLQTDVPGVDAERLAVLAEQARSTCPVSLALRGTEITVAVTKL